MTINLKTLAKSLGLSQTTVSRALNDYNDVSAATRKRIKEAAERLNYQPNARAKSLATGRTKTIGFVISSILQNEMVNPVFGDFVAGASKVYAKHGYSLLINQVDGLDDLSVYENLVSSGKVDGIVVQGPTKDDERIRRLLELKIPFAVHGRSSGLEDTYPWVAMNNQDALRRATKFLIDLGHRKIVLLNGPEHMSFAERRKLGFLDAFQEFGLECDETLLFNGEMTEAYGYQKTKQILDYAERPSAFFTSSLISALGVRRAIEERGLKMGKDISVVTHDDVLSYLPNGDTEPVFTATRSSVSLAGEILANMLIKQIETGEKPEQGIMLETELIVGGSTGPYTV